MLSIKKGVTYIRVSSQRQVTEGNGLDSQLRSCQAYAKEHGIQLIHAFEDKAVSGDQAERPGLQALFEFLATQDEYIAVIVDDVSRLMRNKEMYYPVKIAIENLGGRLFTVKNELNQDDPMSGFMEHILVGVADLERKMNNKRVLDRMKQRLKAGSWVFPAPLGYVHENKTLKIDERNAELLRKLFSDFGRGRFNTYREVKDSLEAKLLINPKNGKRFNLTDTSFKKMIQNKIYIGKIEYEPWEITEVKGLHKPMIEEAVFYAMQNQLKSKGKKRHTKIGLEEFPLKGNVICKVCKTTLTANFSKGRSKSYPYYRCNTHNKKCNERVKNVSRNNLHKQFLTLLEKAKVKKEVLNLIDKVLEDTYKQKNEHLGSIQNQTRKRIQELKHEKRNQISKIEILNDVTIITELEKRIIKIDSEIRTLEDTAPLEDDLKGFKLSGRKLFEDPKNFWLEGDTELKRLVYDFVFDKPLEITNGKVGTAPYSLPYRLLSNPVIERESMVELGGIEPPTSTLPVLRSPS